MKREAGSEKHEEKPRRMKKFEEIHSRFLLLAEPSLRSALRLTFWKFVKRFQLGVRALVRTPCFVLLFLLGGAAAAGDLPDSKLTPGAADPRATVEMICTGGYAAKARHVSRATKIEVFREYGIADFKERPYEVDHLIPLEIGGSNDIRNLWPEPYFTNPATGCSAHVKDRLENKLHRLVCDGQMDLKDAQAEIAADWVSSYNVRVLGRPALTKDRATDVKNETLAGSSAGNSRRSEGPAGKYESCE